MLFKKIKLSCLFFLLFFNILLTQNKTLARIKDMKVNTILVHGTLFPITSTFVHTLDFPQGFYLASDQGDKFIHGRMAHSLHNASPGQFPLESFYMFGWSGILSFKARRKASHDLYHSLENLPESKTLICHSHGCNVALYLAEVAEEHNNTNFKIDRLILLACPVQEVTERYIHSPVFKNIYSFYSKTDMVQVLDPQGLYKETRKSIKDKPSSIFSKRKFDTPHVIHAQIKIDGRDPYHHDFIVKKAFIENLPKIINQIEKMIKSNSKDTNLLVNITSNSNNVKITSQI